MQKNCCKKYILFLFFIFTTVFSWADSGYQKCSKLSSYLSSINVEHKKEDIVFNESNSFPYNIIVTFPSNVKNKEDKKNQQTSELTFALKTEDFYQKKEIIQLLCKSLAEIPHKEKINLLFTYGDIFYYSTPSVISGTEAYASNLSDALSVNVVAVNLSEKNSILPGTKKTVAPTYMSKAAALAFQKNQMFFDIAGGLITFLYPKNFLKTDERANLFSEAGSSCLTVNFKDEEENLEKLPSFFSDFIPLYENPGMSILDCHSNHISFEGLAFFLSERLTLLLFIIGAALSLFVISELSFLNHSTKERLTEDILRLWYLIPLCILVTTLSLFVSQNFSLLLYNLFSANIYIQIALKILLGFILSSLIFLVFLKRQGILISSAYSYLVTISGIINLILFPSLDLCLFYLCAVEYILIYISRPARHTTPLLICFFVLFIPFIPYALQLIKYSKPSSLLHLVKSPLLFNIFLSAALLPFELQWLRILVRLNQKWKSANKGTRKFHIQNIITFSLAFLIFLVISFFADYFIPEKYKNPGIELTKTFVEKEDSSLIDLKITDIKNYGEKTRILSIKVPENARSVHVQICGKKANPVLYSDNDIVQDKGNFTDIFRLPLFPPENITLRYIARQDEKSKIKIFCEVQEKDESFLKLITKEVED
ncbi:MAG: hypothetical protein K6E78_01595 [Treponema sp.]|nr:hypothetical protein [Treponema sp.]